MTQEDQGYFIPSTYSRIVARELELQERDLPRLSQSGHAPINPLATCGLDPSQFDSFARALALPPGYLSTTVL